MKRSLLVITVIVFILSLCACGNTGTPDTTPNAGAVQTPENENAQSSEPGADAQDAQGSFTLTLYADMSGGSAVEGLVSTKEISLPLEDEPASPTLIAFALADGLTEWTGLDFTLNDVIFNDDSVTVDWSADSTLIAGLDDREQKEEFYMFDDVSLNWFMMDSLLQTFRNNLEVTTVCYSSGGGPVTFISHEEMTAQGLPELTADQPYEGSAFFRSHTAADGIIPTTEWEGTYAGNASDQFTNEVLRMKNLSDGLVLFEFESEDEEEERILSGIAIVGGDGIGLYEAADTPQTIEFSMSEDGRTLEVTDSGDTAISPDGTYTFSENGLAFSPVSVVTILEHLPANATSLNHNNGAYVISYAEEPDADGFYSAEAVFAENGETIAKFLVASDMSAVYRVDDDIEPVRIYGMEFV